MELKEVLLKRRSVRKFTDEPVSGEHIDELLHAAMSGPSACNKKPWEFYVVTNEGKLEELKSASKFTKMSSKLAIVVCGNLLHALPIPVTSYWIQDCSAAIENLLLRVTDLGLGADCSEWGYMSLNEVEDVRTPMGFKVEQDVNAEGKTVRELCEEIGLEYGDFFSDHNDYGIEVDEL